MWKIPKTSTHVLREGATQDKTSGKNETQPLFISFLTFALVSQLLDDYTINVQTTLTSSPDPLAKSSQQSMTDWPFVSISVFRVEERANLHIMIIPLDSKREAAVDLRTFGHVGTLQRTARQHGFLLLIKADGAELLPIRDQLIFNNDLVDR